MLTLLFGGSPSNLSRSSFHEAAWPAVRKIVCCMWCHTRSIFCTRNAHDQQDIHTPSQCKIVTHSIHAWYNLKIHERCKQCLRKENKDYVGERFEASSNICSASGSSTIRSPTLIRATSAIALASFFRFDDSLSFSHRSRKRAIVFFCEKSQP